MIRPAGWRLFSIAFLLLALTVSDLRADLDPAIVKALQESRYVYVASTRRDGSLGRPAEIWFFHDATAVYVASPPTSWRVRRIRAGRPRAKIWVGSPSGPSFDAIGAVVRDPELDRKLLEAFAAKYPDGWEKWEEAFRQGLADGSRALVRYTPTDPSSSATPRP